MLVSLNTSLHVLIITIELSHRFLPSPVTKAVHLLPSLHATPDIHRTAYLRLIVNSVYGQLRSTAAVLFWFRWFLVIVHDLGQVVETEVFVREELLG